MKTHAFVLLAAIVFPFTACANDSKTYLDPEKAGAAYEIQGEYLGEIDAEERASRWGAQVIALGDGKFRLVGYEGGLPGDGWQRGDRREMVEGRGAGQVARFEADEWGARIKDGTLTVYTEEGTSAGTLKKVRRKSPTLAAEPPAGALVLFDGSSADHFVGGEMTEDNLLRAKCHGKEDFGDHALHVEFRTPFKPFARGQKRGNSGVYVQSRYEIQVLDSFGLEGKDNECGGIYSIAQPKVNMCFPPLAWQTYDIDFTAARYEGDKKVENARITVKHNGVVIFDNLKLPHGTPGRLDEGPGPAPLYLQGHGNPVFYRNIWAVRK